MGTFTRQQRVRKDSEGRTPNGGRSGSGLRPTGRTVRRCRAARIVRGTDGCRNLRVRCTNEGLGGAAFAGMVEGSVGGRRRPGWRRRIGRAPHPHGQSGSEGFSKSHGSGGVEAVNEKRPGRATARVGCPGPVRSCGDEEGRDQGWVFSCARVVCGPWEMGAGFVCVGVVGLGECGLGAAGVSGCGGCRCGCAGRARR